MNLNNKKNKQVFLIDDNAIFRFLFENLVKSYADEPVDFKSFENALEALDYFEEDKEHIPDILYVDINMPFMTGWELMEKLTEPQFLHLQKSKIYIVSSSNHDSDKEYLEQYPFIKEYLLKPLDKDIFYNSIKQN